MDVKIIPGAKGETFADVRVDGHLNAMAGGFGSDGPFTARIKLRPEGDTLVGAFANWDSVKVCLTGSKAEIRYHDFAREESFTFSADPVT